MKNVFITIQKIIITLVILVVSSQAVMSQTTNETAKERNAISKMTDSQLNSKRSKEVGKEAKRLTKAGWTVLPGAMPIERQLDRTYQMLYELDGDMFPKYIMGEAMSTGENYDAAKVQALELAKQHLAGQIQTEITMLIDNMVINKQLADEQAKSITESVLAGKHLISQSIGRVLPVTELYRTKKDKNSEVFVRIAYHSDFAKETAKNAILRNLEEKGNKLHEQLDNVLGF
jgi:hypothetical protein